MPRFVLLLVVAPQSRHQELPGFEVDRFHDGHSKIRLAGLRVVVVVPGGIGQVKARFLSNPLVHLLATGNDAGNQSRMRS
jgi:hypothetical protein